MRLKTKKPDRRWRRLANKNKWTVRCRHPDAGLESLKQRLLNIGGWSVCLPNIEVDLENLLERGIRFAARAKMMRGEPCQCHSNSAHLWDNNQDISYLCTGYALSRDGMWRVHSWCVVKTPKSYKVIETTEARISYYGYILDPNESEMFLYANF